MEIQRIYGLWYFFHKTRMEMTNYALYVCLGSAQKIEYNYTFGILQGILPVKKGNGFPDIFHFHAMKKIPWEIPYIWS